MRGAQVIVRGQVQGVGFRPAVWRLAQEMGLAGDVKNTAEGVVIRLWGEGVAAFPARLHASLPALARIEELRVEPLEAEAPSGFDIVASEGGEMRGSVTPDAATCADCLAEIRSPFERRYRYPFTNCTNCGPRFSIVTAAPYDRAKTTMAPFDLCEPCSAEYRNPADRRFHAQPVACGRCGPQIWIEKLGRGAVQHEAFSMLDDIDATGGMILNGHIVAIRGLGGVHLACDATNAEAVAELRRRKGRAGKAFALMARDLGVVREYCEVSEGEAAALSGPEAPIVLLKSLPNSLPDGIAPGLDRLGVMLPYTPFLPHDPATDRAAGGDDFGQPLRPAAMHHQRGHARKAGRYRRFRLPARPRDCQPHRRLRRPGGPGTGAPAAPRAGLCASRSGTAAGLLARHAGAGHGVRGEEHLLPCEGRSGDPVAAHGRSRGCRDPCGRCAQPGPLHPAFRPCARCHRGGPATRSICPPRPVTPAPMDARWSRCSTTTPISPPAWPRTAARWMPPRCSASRWMARALAMTARSGAASSWSATIAATPRAGCLKPVRSARRGSGGARAVAQRLCPSDGADGLGGVLDEFRGSADPPAPVGYPPRHAGRDDRHGTEHAALHLMRAAFRCGGGDCGPRLGAAKL